MTADSIDRPLFFVRMAYDNYVQKVPAGLFALVTDERATVVDIGSRGFVLWAASLLLFFFLLPGSLTSEDHSRTDLTRSPRFAAMAAILRSELEVARNLPLLTKLRPAFVDVARARKRWSSPRAPDTIRTIANTT